MLRKMSYIGLLLGFFHLASAKSHAAGWCFVQYYGSMDGVYYYNGEYEEVGNCYNRVLKCTYSHAANGNNHPACSPFSGTCLGVAVPADCQIMRADEEMPQLEN